jgi:hypothetical protein
MPPESERISPNKTFGSADKVNIIKIREIMYDGILIIIPVLVQQQ